MVVLTASERTKLQNRLDEAETALHRRQLGRGVSRIRHGDKDETFVGVSVAELEAYVSRLKGELGLPTGRQAATPVRFG